jgi:hypothetical protein
MEHEFQKSREFEESRESRESEKFSKSFKTQEPPNYQDIRDIINLIENPKSLDLNSNSAILNKTISKTNNYITFLRNKQLSGQLGYSTNKSNWDKQLIKAEKLKQDLEKLNKLKSNDNVNNFASLNARDNFATYDKAYIQIKANPDHIVVNELINYMNELQAKYYGYHSYEDILKNKHIITLDKLNNIGEQTDKLIEYLNSINVNSINVDPKTKKNLENTLKYRKKTAYGLRIGIERAKANLELFNNVPIDPNLFREYVQNQYPNLDKALLHFKNIYKLFKNYEYKQQNKALRFMKTIRDAIQKRENQELNNISEIEKGGSLKKHFKHSKHTKKHYKTISSTKSDNRKKSLVIRKSKKFKS